jgi:short-subunit dehydrogenase
MSRGVLIIGATSGMARAIAERMGRAGDRLALAARDPDELLSLAADVRLRTGAIVEALPLDVTDFSAHAEFVARAVAALGGTIDGVVLCQGFMADQAEAEGNPGLVRRMSEVNHASAASLACLVGDRLTRPGGFVCAISSVAGDRGRQSNFLYGSSKAALNVAMDGLRVKLSKVGVSVTVIKPGFVDTSMTWGLPGMFLVAAPDRVAQDVVRAIAGRRAVVYTPWFWRWIMFIIRMIPAFVFNRMKL